MHKIQLDFLYLTDEYGYEIDKTLKPPQGYPLFLLTGPALKWSPHIMPPLPW